MSILYFNFFRIRKILQVPFGEVNAVRDFLKINGNVRAPKTIHPKRPILGMKCHLSEPSGKRLWGLIKQISGNPDNFFKYCCVHNYCPLALFSKSGANITPDDLKVILIFFVNIALMIAYLKIFNMYLRIMRSIVNVFKLYEITVYLFMLFFCLI